MLSLKLLLLLALGWALAVLAIQNPFTIQLKFLVWKTDPVSLIGVILVSMLLGLLCGLILFSMRAQKKKEVD